MRRRSQRHKEDPKDLDITPLMNLVVTLIPFLLVSAVFTQVGVHNLNMPTLSNAPAAEEQQQKPIVLEVVLYKQRMDLLDRQTGPLKSWPNIDGHYDFDGLVSTLKAVKVRFPEVTDITILMEKDTHYDNLIHTMDAVRTTRQVQDGRDVHVELFPNISIGDAPPDEGTGDTAPAASVAPAAPAASLTNVVRAAT